MSQKYIKSILLNLLFYILVLSIDLIKAFNNSETNETLWDLIKWPLLNSTCIYSLILINHLFLIPHFFDKKKYVLYCFLLFTAIFLIAYYNGHHKSAFKVFLLGNYYTLTTGLGMSIFFLIRSLKIKRELIEKEQLQQQMELNYLKAQVNPHFLFNSLNSIYSLSRQNSPHTPETVMHLSDLMRYQLESAKNDFVYASEEIAFIQNYLLLEEKRLGNKCRIDLSVEGHYEGLKIAPMLLIPFVENAVKYAAQSTNNQSFININIEIKDDFLFFSTENSKPQKIISQKREGTGINNVKRRLNLLYPNKHHLTINNNEDNFTVQLKIGLTNKKL